MVFKTKEDRDQGEECFSDSISLVGKKLNKALNNLDKKLRSNVPDNVSDIGPQRKIKEDEKPIKGKGDQCYECEGLGLIKDECRTILKK